MLQQMNIGRKFPEKLAALCGINMGQWEYASRECTAQVTEVQLTNNHDTNNSESCFDPFCNV